MNEELSIAERLYRLVYNADRMFTWWRLEQESSNLYRFLGVVVGERGEPIEALIVEEATLLDLLAVTRAEGLEEPIPQ